MPYDGEYASKLGHIDVVRNPQVQRFLGRCGVRGQGLVLATDGFAPYGATSRAIDTVFAFDGSLFVGPAQTSGAEVGFLKVAAVRFSMAQYQAMTAARFVDPAAVAQLHRQGQSFEAMLPSKDVIYQPERNKTVADGFRHALRDALTLSVFGKSLLQTLLDLHGGRVRLPSCPVCGARPDERYTFEAPEEEQVCTHCWSNLYASDVLEIDQELSEWGGNAQPIGRVMLVLEHLTLAAALRSLDPEDLARSAFILDGSMALYGPPARLSLALMRNLARLRDRQAALGLASPLVMALQKTGPSVEHLARIAPSLPNGTFRLIDEDYRHNFLQPWAQPHFGRETHYGQEFLLKTQGRAFVLALPYPFADKGVEFNLRKGDPQLYEAEIALAAAVVEAVRLDLYRNALIPVTLAHRRASISSTSGGRVLRHLGRLHIDGQEPLGKVEP